MNVYNYHPITKEYIGNSIADESPLEEDVFLIPAYATTIEPPEFMEGKIRIFENDTWVQLDIVDIPLEENENPTPGQLESQNLKIVALQEENETLKNSLFEVSNMIVDMMSLILPE